MMTVCSECKKALRIQDVGMCMICSAEFCQVCHENGATCPCEHELNEKLDAEEAAASIRELELLWLFSQ